MENPCKVTGIEVGNEDSSFVTFYIKRQRQDVAKRSFGPVTQDHNPFMIATSLKGPDTVVIGGTKRLAYLGQRKRGIGKKNRKVLKVQDSALREFTKVRP